MSRALFDQWVRPALTVVRIGKQGLAVDREELDAWADRFFASKTGLDPQNEPRDNDTGSGPGPKGGNSWGVRKTTGLTCRNGVWHIQKRIKGYGRLRESTGSSNYQEAERYLIHRIQQIRNASMYGVRPKRIFREAATKYLLEHQHMPSIGDTAIMLKQLDPYLGHVPLDRIHDGVIAEFVRKRQAVGVSHRTINMAIERVTRILRLAARVWRDEHGLTWLETAPLLSKLDERKTRRNPYPLSWEEEQDCCFRFYLITWPEWRSSRSTLAVVSRKSADCAGTGKWMSRSWAPASF